MMAIADEHGEELSEEDVILFNYILKFLFVIKYIKL